MRQDDSNRRDSDGSRKRARTRGRHAKLLLGLVSLFVVGLLAAGAFGQVLTGSDTTSGTDTTSVSTTDTSGATTTDTTATDTTTAPSTDTTSTDTSTPPPPAATLATDRTTYVPGDTVTVTGADWLPNESIHVHATDTGGNGFSYDADVIAATDGSISASFALPTPFAGDFAVAATGAVEGTVSASFSDAFAAVVGPPAIVSDQADYGPGSTVTLTGTGWRSLEGVHVFVNDSVGNTWSYSADVTADATGDFTTQFQLPNTLIANYDVTATGSSGDTASTSFTDAPATNITAVSYTPATTTAGASGNWTIGFTTSASGALGATDTITIGFNAAFTPAASPTVSLGSGFNAHCNATATSAGSIITVTLGNQGGPSCALPASTAATLTVGSVTNPAPSSYAANTFNMSTSADTRSASPSTAVVITSRVSGVTFSGSSQVAGATNTTWTVGYTTSAFGALGNHGTITVTFNSAFVVPATPTIGLTGGFSGCSASGSATGTVVTITLGGGGCSLAASTGATLTIAGITNPAANTYAASSFSVATSADTTPTNPALAVVISPGVLSTSTSLALHTGANPSIFGDSLTFRATVSPTPSGGTVEFKDGLSDISGCAAVAVSGGVADCTTSALAVAGSPHSITAIYSGTTGFTGSTSSALSHTVNKAASVTTVTCSAGPFTYDGSAQTPCSVSVTGAGGLSLTPTASYSNNTGAGTATASYTYAGDANHTGSSDSKNFAIAQAASVTTVTCSAGPFTYDGSAQTPCSVSVTGAGGLSLTPTASYSNNTGAGTATASYTYAGDANHTGSSDSKDFTISKHASTVHIVWADSTYDGTPNAASATATGVAADGNLAPTPSLAYYSGPTATGTPLASAPTNAGTYTVKADFAGNGNYDPSSDTQTITISKHASTVHIVWADSTYDGTPNAASATATGVAADGNLAPTPSLAYYSGPTATGTPLASAPTNAGTYTVKADFAGNGNYDPSSDTQTITISKHASTVHIVWADSTYDGTPNAASATATGVAADGNLAPTPSLAYYSGPTATGTPLASAPTNAGTYTVKADFAGNGNYDPSSDTQTITISKHASTVHIVWADSTYDGTPNAASATATGVAADGNLAPTPSLAYYSGPTATGTPLASAPTNAGTYTVKADFAGNGNYDPSSDTQTITISKATQPIAFGSLANRTLGSPDFTVSATGGGSGNAVTFASTTTGVCTVSGNTVHLLAVGTCTIAADQAGNANYLAAPEVTQSFNVLYASAGTCLGSPGHAILQPINADGTSVFKQGSTVPAKFRICDANGNSIGTPGVVKSFSYAVQNGTVVPTIDEVVDSTTPDTAFRWSPSDQQWIFNISTKGLTANKTYIYLITLNDNSTITFKFGLK